VPRVKAGSAHEHSNSRRRQPTSQRSQRSTYPELPHSPAGAIAPRTNRGELVRRAGATPRAPACGGIIYDRIGNLLELFHSAGGGANTWTRTYSYTTGTNQLASNTIPGGSATYTHDAHGSITSMPHLASITYGPFDQMANADLGGGGDAYYQYDASGQRVRKLIDTGANLIKERIYLGAYEIYREHISGDIDLERQSLHVMDGTRRVAVLETLTIEDGNPVTTPVTHQRFQLGNHLDSALLEVDEAGMVVSYEELLPYGASAYRSARSDVDVSPRRYRYTGKERDDETGLYYYGARYYACWLGRWTSADPLGIGADGPGLYNYTRGSPVVLVDPTGGEPMPPPAAGVSPPPPPPPPGKPPSFGQRVSAATRSIARGLRQASSASAGGSPPPTASATASSGGESSVLGNVLSGAAEEVGHKASSLAKGVIDHPLQALQSATPLGAGAALVTGAISSSTRIIETAMASATVASGDESQRQFGKLLVNLVELALTVAPFAKGSKGGTGSTSTPPPASAGSGVPDALPPGRPNVLIRNKLEPHEVSFAEQILEHRGGTMVGQSKRGTPGIDAMLDGTPVSLKQTKGQLGAVLRRVSEAEAQAKAAGVSGVEVFVKAPNVERSNLVDFARKGPLVEIPSQGTVTSINVLTSDGWVRIVAPPGPARR
jgi:RHS repeat-associated protein